MTLVTVIAYVVHLVFVEFAMLGRRFGVAVR